MLEVTPKGRLAWLHRWFFDTGFQEGHARLVENGVAWLIIFSVMAIAAEHVEPLHARYAVWFHVLDVMTVGVFTVEYLLRVLVAPLEPEFAGRRFARVRYIFSFYALVDLIGAPCTNTLMGLGAYRASSRQFVGMPGMHGTYEANMAMQHCDVLLAIGVRFDDRVIGNPKHFAQNPRKIIHIDIDPSSISKRVKVDLPIVGDVKDSMQELISQLKESAGDSARTSTKSLKPWWDQIEQWRAKDCLAYKQSDELIKPQFVVQKLWEVTGGDAYVTSDVGQHQMFAAQFFPFDKPRRWINSGGLGTMGVGLPYAMGVLLAHPDATVACITGEGSIQMNIQELSTCKQYQLPVKIINLNNRYLGMVRQWQEIEYGSRYSQSYMDALPDFVALAQAYGHVGLRIENPADVESALRDAFGKYKDRLVFLDFITDQTENVWPMVQGGKGLTEMILGAEDL